MRWTISVKSRSSVLHMCQALWRFCHHGHVVNQPSRRRDVMILLKSQPPQYRWMLLFLVSAATVQHSTPFRVYHTKRVPLNSGVDAPQKMVIQWAGSQTGHPSDRISTIFSESKHDVQKSTVFTLSTDAFRPCSFVISFKVPIELIRRQLHINSCPMGKVRT